MQRLDYFLRRLLLMIPTFIGITLVCFIICLLVPGGPVEQEILKLRGLGGGSDRMAGSRQISEEMRKKLREEFGFDQPILVQYWRWLIKDRLGLMRRSYQYREKTAFTLIVERFRISLIFGITGFVLTYLICIPLGIMKAIRDGHPFDWISSIIVFVGYAIPPFAFGMLLKMIFCGTVSWGWDIFPLAGFVSDNYEALTVGEKIIDIMKHMFLPLLCYIIGDFAVLTLLMKNSLLEEINKDYVRSVLARGATLNYVIFRHVLRNSLIPIATGFGNVLTLMFAGSVFIEKVFEIPGMGRLSLEALVTRDYAVFMAILTMTTILGLVGNLLSDFLYVIIDPRINFEANS